MKYLNFLKRLKAYNLFVIYILLISFSSFADENEMDTGKQAYFEHNYQLAIETLSPLVKSGNAVAQYYSGLSFIDTNPNEAFRLLLSAAKQNHKKAMHKIADLYESGTGVEADLLSALDWYRKAKKFNSSNPENIIFVNADNQKQSNQTMINKLIEAANKSDIDANMQLAIIYDDGILTKHDAQQSFHWLSRAASLGNKNAMLSLGYFHCRGIGTNIDHKKANSWFEKSERVITCRQEKLSKE